MIINDYTDNLKHQLIGSTNLSRLHQHRSTYYARPGVPNLIEVTSRLQYGNWNVNNQKACDKSMFLPSSNIYS